MAPSRLLAALAGALALLAPLAAQAAAPSASDLTRAASMQDVSISRDGKHIAALTSPDGKTTTISVWSTDNLRAPPTVLGSERMRIIDVGFLKNDRLLVTAMQPYDYGSTRMHITKQFVTDLKGSEWRPLLPTGGSRSADFVTDDPNDTAQLLDPLPLDPNYVMVIDQRRDSFGDVYRVNVYKGVAERISRGSEKFPAVQTDLKGEVRSKLQVDYDDGKIYIAQWLKHPDTGAFEEHFRWYAKDRVPMEVLGFDTDPNLVYLRTAKGRDKAGIYLYDIRARKIVEPVFEHKMFEASDLVRSPRRDNYGQVLGFSYQGEGQKVFWVDPQLAALNKGVRASLGLKPSTLTWTDPGTGEQAKISVDEEADAQIVSVSEDLRYAIVTKSGPSLPAEYYLLTSDGKLALLGKSRGWIDPAAIGETRLVQYPARDGLMIPAFLSTPPKSVFGPGPYPTIIMPHGGPWARDYLEWDVSGWPQYLTSRGYAVLKPQFRGSEGWGQKLWRAGDNEWGQKMQDDKDDGAKWLISQRIAAPERIAMFGYSYGGYAALAAAIRPNGLYQCAISGAGAPDLAEFRKSTYENRYQREFQNPTIGGLDALDRAKDASIPVLLYHGDRDTIVDIKQSQKFAAALKSAGKPYKYVKIEDMGHQYMTMTPAMMERQLVEIESYLKNDCGPGGL